MKRHQILLIPGSLMSLILVIAVGMKLDWQGSEEGTRIYLLLFFLLPLIPILIPVAAGLFFKNSKAAVFTCLAGMIAAFGFMAFLYINAFYLNPDPQGGLVMIFGPIYALAVLFPFMITAVILFFRDQKRGKD